MSVANKSHKKVTFAELLQKIEETRNNILVGFDSLDRGEYESVSTETKIDAVRVMIEEYAEYVNAFLSIDTARAATYKLPIRERETGLVRLMPFPADEIEKRKQLYEEDVEFFADRFEMFVLKYFLASDAAQAVARRKRICMLYNQVPSVRKRSTRGLTPELLQDILLKCVFKDSPDFLDLFRDKKSFFDSLMFGSPAAKRIEKEVNGFLIGFNPTGDEEAAFKRNAMESLDLSLLSLQEALGFSNPFDNLSSSTTTTASFNEKHDTPNVVYKYDEYGNAVEPGTRPEISKIRVHDIRPKVNVVYSNRGGEARVSAGRDFFPGDIIEVCPVKIMEEKDLYSRNIRDSVFPLDKKERIFGLPLGHAICYRNDMDAKGLEGNVRYEYNENDGTITIIATRRIRKGNELLFHAEESDFANELHPYDFRYDDKPIDISKITMRS